MKGAFPRLARPQIRRPVARTSVHSKAGSPRKLTRVASPKRQVFKRGKPVKAVPRVVLQKR